MAKEIERSILIDEIQQKTLLDFSRQTIISHIQKLPLPQLAKEDELFSEQWGAFVTIYMGGQLRGCIGRLETKKTLAVTLQEISISAATEDPRFYPMREEDLGIFRLKISILSPIKQISSVEEIEVGMHGLMIQHAGRRGVLLPQVPVEQGWGRETFLERVCVKAGLPADTWKKKAKLLTFTTFEFGDI